MNAIAEHAVNNFLPEITDLHARAAVSALFALRTFKRELRAAERRGDAAAVKRLSDVVSECEADAQFHRDHRAAWRSAARVVSF